MGFAFKWVPKFMSCGAWLSVAAAIRKQGIFKPQTEAAAIILSIKNYDIAQHKSHAQLFLPYDGVGHENKAAWIPAGA